jgi:DNA-binding NarL/FixJ family response regulator
MQVFVLDPHTIYRRGLASCLELLDAVRVVGQAESVREAWRHESFRDAELVLVDQAVEGGREFIPAVRSELHARVLVCTSEYGEEQARDAIRLGAVGFLRKDTLTVEALAAAVRATASGAGILAPELLGMLLGARGDAALPPRPVLARLTRREQQVLALIADGHATREVAEQLSYSERTVKNVLHDAATKLHARSRSQAVAQAVRAGLI